MAAARGRGMQWDYPAIEDVSADLLLVTHEHFDHNAVDVIGGQPAILRSTAGRHESPVGEVVGVASEHDQAAGTERGPNTIFVFTLDGVRVAHFGDFGQPADSFIEKFDDAHRCAEPSFETGDLAVGERPVVVVPAVP
jgi:L-ascorbate metabolism protein UlaG (beta-lactamase superfamily)